MLSTKITLRLFLYSKFFIKHFNELTSPASPGLDWPRLREIVCRLIVRLPSSEICQWRVDEVNTILQCLENTKPASNCSFRNQYPVVTASEQIRTLQRVNRVRDGVQVMVLLAFSCLPIVCYANPQSAFYPWPVVVRYGASCSYVSSYTHLLIRHS